MDSCPAGPDKREESRVESSDIEPAGAVTAAVRCAPVGRVGAPRPKPIPRPRAQRAEAPGLVLYAVIKSSSKYAYQNREGGRVAAMEVEELEQEGSEYPFRLENGNRHRREDLTFYVREAKTGRLVKQR